MDAPFAPVVISCLIDKNLHYLHSLYDVVLTWKLFNKSTLLWL